MRKGLLILVILVLPMLLLIAGCAHQISDKSLAMADRTISFAKLRGNPDAYRGKFVLLGGVIATIKDVQEGTQLEVVQHDLDSREIPDATSVSGGRFLAITPDSLDVAKCKRGAVVTMAGEVTGRKVQSLQGVDYVYPVIAVKELHLIETATVDENYFFRTWTPYGP
ncbi:MAG TPA: Slp family lipoprotein [Geobacteraceae bacterium]|nr:Slp family lipoprotein [Geobacteraceae bacterium]